MEYVGQIYEKSTYLTLEYRLDHYLVIDQYFKPNPVASDTHPVLLCLLSDMRTGETHEVSARQLDRQWMYKLKAQ